MRLIGRVRRLEATSDRDAQAMRRRRLQRHLPLDDRGAWVETLRRAAFLHRFHRDNPGQCRHLIAVVLAADWGMASANADATAASLMEEFDHLLDFYCEQGEAGTCAAPEESGFTPEQALELIERAGVREWLATVTATNA